METVEAVGAAFILIGAVLGAIGSATPGLTPGDVKAIQEDAELAAKAALKHDRITLIGWCLVIVGSGFVFWVPAGWVWLLVVAGVVILGIGIYYQTMRKDLAQARQRAQDRADAQAEADAQAQAEAPESGGVVGVVGDQ